MAAKPMPFKGRTRLSYPYGRYGYTRGKGQIWHGGYDLEGIDSGIVLSCVAGTVIRARVAPWDPIDKTYEWGKYVTVRTQDGIQEISAHLSDFLVKQGDVIKVGTPLGHMGATGNAAGGYAHLHREYRNSGNKAVDPSIYCGVPNAVGIYGNAPSAAESEDDMKFLEAFGYKNCQCFNSANINDIHIAYNNGTLKPDTQYPIIADAGEDKDGLHWYRCFVAGDVVYAALLADRCKIVSLSPGDAVMACVAQAALCRDEAEIKKLQDKLLAKDAQLGMYSDRITRAKKILEE